MYEMVPRNKLVIKFRCRGKMVIVSTLSVNYRSNKIDKLVVFLKTVFILIRTGDN